MSDISSAASTATLDDSDDVVGELPSRAGHVQAASRPVSVVSQLQRQQVQRAAYAAASAPAPAGPPVDLSAFEKLLDDHEQSTGRRMNRYGGHASRPAASAAAGGSANASDVIATAGAAASETSLAQPKKHPVSELPAVPHDTMTPEQVAAVSGGVMYIPDLTDEPNASPQRTAAVGGAGASRSAVGCEPLRVVARRKPGDLHSILPSARRLPPGTIPQLKALWRMLDEDRDGWLTAEQVRTALAAAGVPPTPAMVHALCAAAAEDDAAAMPEPDEPAVDFASWLAAVERYGELEPIVYEDVLELVELLREGGVGRDVPSDPANCRVVSPAELRRLLCAPTSHTTQLAPEEAEAVLASLPVEPLGSGSAMDVLHSVRLLAGSIVPCVPESQVIDVQKRGRDTSAPPQPPTEAPPPPPGLSDDEDDEAGWVSQLRGSSPGGTDDTDTAAMLMHLLQEGSQPV